MLPECAGTTAEPVIALDALCTTLPAAAPGHLLPACLAELFAALDANRVRWCVLRNCIGIRSDIDILLSRRDERTLLNIIQTLQCGRITALAREPDSMHVYLAGLETGFRAHLHFMFELSWKGFPYLDADNILASAAPSVRWPALRLASEPNAAVATLLEHLLGDGTIRQNQRAYLVSAFRQFPAVRDALAAAFGEHAAQRITSDVQSGRWPQAEAMTWSLRGALLRKHVRRDLIGSVRRIAAYFAGKLRARFDRSNLVSVAFLGPDGSGKTTLISTVSKALAGAAGPVQLERVRPHLLYDRHNRPQTVLPDPHAIPPQPRLLSLLKFAIWSVELWLNRHLTRRQSCTVQLFDRYYHDLLIDPLRYRFAGPMRLAGWLARHTPEPDLWVLLEANPATLAARKQDLPLEEIARLYTAYRSFGTSRKHLLVIDAEKQPSEVAEQACAAILRRMNELAERRIRALA